MLDSLLAEGIKYVFVSNSDNLGATLDLKLLNHFASTSQPFCMEVAERTESDKKGGHLCKRKSDGAHSPAAAFNCFQMLRFCAYRDMPVFVASCCKWVFM